MAAPEQPESKKQSQYFRSIIAGLTVVVDQADGEGSERKRVRFTPILQRWDGEMQRFGYLKTNDERVIDRLLTDPNVTKIDRDEYTVIMKRADDPTEPNVKRSHL